MEQIDKQAGFADAYRKIKLKTLPYTEAFWDMADKSDAYKKSLKNTEQALQQSAVNKASAKLRQSNIDKIKKSIIDDDKVYRKAVGIDADPKQQMKYNIKRFEEVQNALRNIGVPEKDLTKNTAKILKKTKHAPMSGKKKALLAVGAAGTGGVIGHKAGLPIFTPADRRQSIESAAVVDPEFDNVLSALDSKKVEDKSPASNLREGASQIWDKIKAVANTRGGSAAIGGTAGAGLAYLLDKITSKEDEDENKSRMRKLLTMLAGAAGGAGIGMGIQHFMNKKASAEDVRDMIRREVSLMTDEELENRISELQHKEKVASYTDKYIARLNLHLSTKP